MESRVFARHDVNTRAVEKMLDTFEKIKTAPRALKILKGGEPVLSLSFAPYNIAEPMYLYSLSKPYTSVAVGICCDMGLLSPETKMCELFADKMPAELTEGLKKLTLADLLTMRCGHGRCVIEDMRWSDDALKAFFAFPMQFEPGTTFVYSTGATCVCAAAVERVTGRKMIDFTEEKLFSVLGVKTPEWRECRDGTCLGGTGLLVDIETQIRFQQMLLQKGVYNGKRVVSEEYLALATSAVTQTYKDHPSKDWGSGYGFQFWQNGRGGFRGDGAYGQIGFVLPAEDTVLAFFGESFDAVAEFNAVNEMLDNLYTPGEHDAAALERRCAALYTPEKGEESPDAEAGFAFEPNGLNISGGKLAVSNGKMRVVLYTDVGERSFVCGEGEYLRSSTSLRGFDSTQVPQDPRLNSEMPFEVYGAYSCVSEGVYKLTLRKADTCHTQYWTFDFTQGRLNIETRMGNLCVKEFRFK